MNKKNAAAFSKLKTTALLVYQIENICQVVLENFTAMRLADLFDG